MARRLACLLLAFWSAFGGAAWAEEVTITLGGDCVLGTREEWKGEAYTFDTVIEKEGYGWCFSQIAEPFLTDDISLVNLEVVLQDGSEGHQRGKEYTFRGAPAYTAILREAGIEQVNIANNHTIDFGLPGRESTRSALSMGNIAYSGFTYRYTRTVNGYKIGFAGCRETTYLEDRTPVKQDLEALRAAGCDVIVYSYHWGKEYSPTHNRTQENMADYAIRNGADLVVGTHPHCVQGVEARGGGVVLYSLGNLVFGGTHEMTTFDAVVAQAVLSFDGGEYQGLTLRLMPVLTSSARPENNFRPEWATGADYERIMDLIQADSDLTVQDEMWFPAP